MRRMVSGLSNLEHAFTRPRVAIGLTAVLILGVWSETAVFAHPEKKDPTDQTPPSVWIWSSAASKVLPGTKIEVSVKAKDFIGVASVGLSAAGLVSFVEEKKIDPAQQEVRATFIVEVSEDAENGDIQLVGFARDKSGNRGESNSVTVSVRRPTPKPTKASSKTPTKTSKPTSTPKPTSTLRPTKTKATLAPTATQPPATTTPVETSTDTPEPTETATPEPTATATEVPTDTPTETATPEPTATATEVPTDTPTETATPEPTATATRVTTDTPTETATPEPTATATETPTDTPTQTPTHSPTLTPTVPPTDTPTETPTWTPTWTFTPPATPTSTATFTVTATPVPTCVTFGVAATAVSDSSNGALLAWANPGFARSCDTQSASARVQRFEGGLTHYLRVTGYGFSTVPDGATILGIRLSVRKDQLGPGNATDARVSLVDPSGALSPDNKAVPGSWPANGVVTYGGANDTWGRSWTGADLKSPNFGWVISANTTRDNNLFSDFFALVNCGTIEVCFGQ